MTPWAGARRRWRARRPPVRVAGFGPAPPHSDADVAIWGAAGLDLAQRLRLASRLRGIRRVPDVDLIVLEEARRSSYGAESSGGVALYALDEGERVEFEVRTLSKCLDLLPTLQEHTR
jgi:hypothetical protein